MVAIGFKVYKDKILSGDKRQTIRPYSEKRYKSLLKNRKLQLYWKLRTKDCEFLKEVELKDLFIIKLYSPTNIFDFHSSGYPVGHVFRWGDVRWYIMSPDNIIDLAKRDGFDSVPEMYKWFRNQYGKKVYDMNFMVIRW